MAKRYALDLIGGAEGNRTPDLCSAIGSRSVFAGSAREDEPISANAVTRAMAQFVAELKISRISPHDLRRTIGTEMARPGLPVHVRSLVLNHSPMSCGVTGAIHNRYAYDKEKREALAAWEAHLAQIITRHTPRPGTGALTSICGAEPALAAQQGTTASDPKLT